MSKPGSGERGRWATAGTLFLRSEVGGRRTACGEHRRTEDDSRVKGVQRVGGERGGGFFAKINDEV